MLNAMTRAFNRLIGKADRDGADAQDALRARPLVQTRETVDTAESAQTRSAPTSIGHLRSRLPRALQTERSNARFVALAEHYLAARIQTALAAMNQNGSSSASEELAIATAHDTERYRSESNAILQDFVQGQTRRFQLYTRYRNGFTANGRFTRISDLKAAFITSTYEAFIRACEALDQLTPPPPYQKLIPSAPPSYEDAVQQAALPRQQAGAALVRRRHGFSRMQPNLTPETH